MELKKRAVPDREGAAPPGNRLEVRDLSVAFRLPAGEALAVDRVSFGVAKGETLALVGESGCGKSVTCLALMRLLPTPPARLAGGSIVLSGRELTTLPDRKKRDVRGTAMSKIFQEPMTSFDTAYPLGSLSSTPDTADAADSVALSRPALPPQ